MIDAFLIFAGVCVGVVCCIAALTVWWHLETTPRRRQRCDQGDNL